MPPSGILATCALVLKYSYTGSPLRQSKTLEKEQGECQMDLLRLATEVHLPGIGTVISLPLDRSLSLPMQVRQIACSMKVENLSLEASIGCTHPGKGPHERA